MALQRYIIILECGVREGFSAWYIEAKDVGKSLDVAERSEQLDPYLQSLESLVLTDYLEFR